MSQKMYLPRDVRGSEIKSKQDRMRANKKSHVENLLYGELKKRGEVGIRILNTDMDKQEIVAIFSNKKSTFNFKRNHLGNFFFKNVEASFDNAEVIDDKPQIDTIEIDPEVIFDLSQFIAEKVGMDIYNIHYPTVRELGTLKQDELTIDRVKTLAALYANSKGRVVKFVGDFKLAMADSKEEIENLIIENVPITKDPYSKAVGNHYMYVKDNKFDMDPTKSLRANTIKKLEIHAQNIVKNPINWSSNIYSTGVITILSTDSVVEYDKGFNGHILIKVKMKNKILSCALPVEFSQLKIKEKLSGYIVDEKEFIDKIRQAEEVKIKQALDHDANMLGAKVLRDAEVVTKIARKRKIAGFRDVDTQKVMEIPREHFDNLLDIGKKINLQGIMYEVQEGSAPTLYRLVKVN